MQASLTIIRGDGTPKTCQLDPSKRITVGRSRDNNVVLQDERASRLHARVYCENGQWMLADNHTLNGTRVGGLAIDKPVVLSDGLEFEIAETRLRFSSAACTASTASPTPMDSSVESSCDTPWHGDELVVLHNYMTRAAQTNEPQEVIRTALTTILQHTHAAVAGLMSLDEDNAPFPRVVLPDLARVDIVLSKNLIVQVKKDRKTVWLHQARSPALANSESLLPFNDAICVPLRTEGAPLAALHVYRAAKRFNEREVRFCEMVAGYLANILGRLRMFRSLEAENSWLKRRAPISEDIIGDSAAIQQLRQLIAKAAACPSTVLIQGETGSGKELVAQALHRGSARHAGPFVVANCGAIAPTLLEAELFGYVRGAFTGADRNHQGFFEQADEGTLFLDEIGDMTLDCQVKVLRALEAKTIRPVGGAKEVNVDVRVIAASHKDLAREMKAGRFREDLFYRLRVICLTVPPLRQHAEDVPVLAERLLAKFASDTGRRKRLSAAALARLRDYSWPGNVRELRTVLECAVMMTDPDQIDTGDLWLQGSHPPDQPLSLRLEDLEAWAIGEALKRHKGNITAAARTLGISRETLAQKIKKYNISRGGDEP